MNTSIWQVIGLALLAVCLIVCAGWILTGYRVSPEKRERLRRQMIARRGRITDGNLNESSPDHLYYSYSVAGVQYTASQDITTLYERLPSDPERLAGHVWVKYMTNNPANSIVIAELWSGLTNSKQENIA